MAISKDKRRIIAPSPTQGGGVSPIPGYTFLRGKQTDGSYLTLRGKQADSSYVSLSGKAA